MFLFSFFFFLFSSPLFFFLRKSNQKIIQSLYKTSLHYFFQKRLVFTQTKQNKTKKKKTKTKKEKNQPNFNAFNEKNRRDTLHFRTQQTEVLSKNQEFRFHPFFTYLQGFSAAPSNRNGGDGAAELQPGWGQPLSRVRATVTLLLAQLWPDSFPSPPKRTKTKSSPKHLLHTSPCSLLIPHRHCPHQEPQVTTQQMGKGSREGKGDFL